MATGLSIGFQATNVGTPFRRWSALVSSRVSKAIEVTAQETQAELESRIRADLANAGNFGGGWISGFRVERTTSTFGGIQISVIPQNPLFMVYVNGAVIKGRPLLWLPAPWADDAKGLEGPRDYPGRLMKVVSKTKSQPLLVRVDTHEVKYIGLESVKMPKKFHTLEIIQDVANNIPQAYEKALAG